MSPDDDRLNQQIENLRKKLHISTMQKPDKLTNQKTYRISRELDKLIYKMMSGK